MPLTEDDTTWDPRSPEVLDNQIAAYDALRGRCPVAHSDYLGWSVLRHEDVSRVLAEHETFSNYVSAHVAVPNGMDPPEHTVFRAIVDKYYTDDVVDAFEPTCRAIARALVAALPRGESVEIMSTLGEPFAMEAQAGYLGWPAHLHEPLRRWNSDSRAATLSGDREAIGAVAEQFDGYITGLLAERRALAAAGAEMPHDLTMQLLSETVDGRPLTDGELVSILRNWTVGELGTIAASVGIIVDMLARRPEVQARLREDPSVIRAATDEMLRIEPPLISNRRVVAQPTELAGRQFEPGDKLTILWASANRDERVFGDPDDFRLDRPEGDNLVYGAGIHDCPGAPLARLELQVITEELLAATSHIGPDPQAAPVRAPYPAGGFSEIRAVLV